MNPHVEKALTIDARLKDAQLRLTMAGDLVDPHKSLLHLSAALTAIVQAERLLHPDDSTNQPDGVILRNLSHRHRAKLLGTETTPETIERLLSSPSDASPTLINDAIPAVWRIIKGVMADAHSQRPWGMYRLKAIRVAMFLACLCLLYMALRLLLPLGTWVVYYNDVDLKKPTAVRTEFNLNKAYEEERPAAFVHRNRWSARWSGKFYAPKKDSYSFYIQSDDGVRFWVDDQLIIDNWQDTKWNSSGQHGAMTLSAGRHRFRLEHYKRNGNGAVRVRWTGGGIPPNTVLGYPYLFKY